MIARKRIANYFENQVLQAPHIFYYDSVMEDFDLHTGTGEKYGDDRDSTRDFRLYEADP